MGNGCLPNPDARTTIRQRHQRRRSHTTSNANGNYGSIHDSDAGAFKVVIERPQANPRPNTAEALGKIAPPMLEVTIPHYRLGTPRFSMRGTAFLRNSSYTATATEDVRSSIHSKRDNHSLFTAMTPTFSDSKLSRRHSHSSPQQHFFCLTPSIHPEVPLSPPPVPLTPSAIDIGVFDTLTFPPGRDDPLVVRYSGSGQMTAATPPRLVAEITSARFLDYELLSDFFLTFRSFLTTSDLLSMLITRLRWALSRDDEVGMVVRVRTFVAIRHWILNYFMDDYVADYQLRVKFCELLNAFVQEVKQDLTSEASKLKILGELKKCWRRTCALYWDGPDFSNDLGAEDSIKPGGIAGHRDPSLDPNFLENDDAGPRNIDDVLRQDRYSGGAYNFFAEVSRIGNYGTPNTITTSVPPIEITTPPAHEDSTSPRSIMSFDAVSCSIPTRAMRAAHRQMPNHPMAAHPLPPSTVWGNDPSRVQTSKSNLKRAQTANTHKRNHSLSDSVRDDRQDRRLPIQKVIGKSTQILLSLPYASGLVRGNQFPPGQAFVDVAPEPPYLNRASASSPDSQDVQKSSSAISGPGMKKLFNGVRRALSTRQAPSNGAGNGSPISGYFSRSGASGSRAENRVGTANASGAGSAPLRIDLLGAGVAQDFQNAVRQDTGTVPEQNGRISHSTIGRASRNEDNEPSLRVNFPLLNGGPTSERTHVNGMTSSSKLTVSFDNTSPLQFPPSIAEALASYSSQDASEDAYPAPTGGLTPPTTPPDQFPGSPRRSSPLLGDNTHTRQRSLSVDGAPSLIENIKPTSEADQTPFQHRYGRPSVYSQGKSFKSGKSMSLRRYASYQSGFTRHATERSFDATTFTESIRRSSSIPSMPAPLRLLRRRPGGDLRAINTVGDLDGPRLRRALSTGSITTYSNSIRSSYLAGRDSNSYVDVIDPDVYSQRNERTFSLGALAEASPKRQVSFFDTHSSQPVLRPSFEAEAAKLAQIPDDDFDDGGVESALLKLEGKFEQRRSDVSTMVPDLPTSPNHFGRDTFDCTGTERHEDDEDKRKHRHKHVDNEVSHTPPVEVYRPQQIPQSVENLRPAVYQPSGMEAIMPSMKNSPVNIGSAGSDGRNRMEEPGSPIMEAMHPSPDHNSEFSHPSIEVVNETNSIRGIKDSYGNDLVPRQRSTYSEISSDISSDISSEMSLEFVSRDEYQDRNFSFPQVRNIITSLPIPAAPFRHPPSPPVTSEPSINIPENSNIPQVHEHQLSPLPLPPTPDITPILPNPHTHFGSTSSFNNPIDQSHKSMHLPFILAYPSHTLAEQFTLIETSSLTEIDWQDLISMRWRTTHSPKDPRQNQSWFAYLRSSVTGNNDIGSRGVEIVIARFNIMVKWAVSEILLTQDIEERARVVGKFIRIARECRRIRNFASMYQITVALTSKDVTRLSRTWERVGEWERGILADLEKLCTPTRNFRQLRSEMEDFDVTDETLGTVPFVGIYTGDLVFNSLRPDHIGVDGKELNPNANDGTGNGGADGMGLVNFDKCRTTAHIVKGLLRLLEASGGYRVQPIEGITERCLWVAALGDEEIRRLAMTLE
jgi:hypothetical protein